jgi:demethylmenaquinone methyltransferase / 2-methoxy-6-polyprenyl-1,4-benzoquinol methylase
MTGIVPDTQSSESKKQQVAKMFDNISPYYDFLNHFLSVGIDKRWRRKAVRKLLPVKPQQTLDIATGTGDLAIEASKVLPGTITGVDISEGMLAIGRKKINKMNLAHVINLQYGDSENLPFPDNHFNAAMVAFGVRNFENLEKGLTEINRVLKPGGKLVILEFSKPEKFPVKQFYNFYFFRILPFIGKIISRDRRAYNYLPESVAAFSSGSHFLKVLEKTGYKNTSAEPLTFGISSIYTGIKL